MWMRMSLETQIRSICEANSWIRRNRKCRSSSDSARAEEEISELDDEVKKSFLKLLVWQNQVWISWLVLLTIYLDLELTSQLVKRGSCLDLLKRGMKAPQAAGIIHSDFEKGFIRAVTMSYDDLIKIRIWKGCKRSWTFAWRRKRICRSRWRYHGIPL